MNSNGLSLLNVGTSLDFGALTGQQNSNHDEDHEESEGDEDEENKRNEELKDVLFNGFDDLIEDSDLETNGEHHISSTDHSLSQNFLVEPSKVTRTPKNPYVDSIYSPVCDISASTTQHADVDDSSQPNNNNTPYTSTSLSHKKHCVRFSPSEDIKSIEEREEDYLSSGHNSKQELEILYGARGLEISKLTAELHDLRHKVVLLEGEKTGLKVTMEASDRVLYESRDENRHLQKELECLNEKLQKTVEANKDLTSKLEAAQLNSVNQERQIFDLKLFQSNHKDANRQEILLNDIKARYENDLSTLRNELKRVRSELDHKNESCWNLEKKLQDVTEMHERTLTERAANLQEFNRALDQQRQLREQRDNLTSATLLDQLSKAKEEIDRLKAERISQTLSDSMTQMRLGAKDRDAKHTERIVNNLETRLESSEKNAQYLEETVRQLQKERETLTHEMLTLSEESRYQSGETERLRGELNSVKELYLNVCREKDSIEDLLHKITAERTCLEKEKQQLVSELENNNRLMDENLNQHKATIEANAAAKLDSVIQESVARARLEWLKEKSDHVNDLVHVEKSLGELQCLRESMDALRYERDNLQKELIQRDQQLQMEKHLLNEKFQREKETLNRNWEAKLSAASEKAEQNQNNSLMAVTANTMARLKQQFEEEKLLIINNYEKQIMELQSTPSTPTTSSNLIGSDWRTEMSRVKLVLRNTKGISADMLLGLESALQKAEIAWQRDQNAVQFYNDKYKTLKRRVRDYKKSIANEIKKCKEERQRSEDYCLRFISEVLTKVTCSFQQLKCQAPPLSATNHAATVGRVNYIQPAEGSTYAQSMDEIRRQVNHLVEELTTFSK